MPKPPSRRVAKAFLRLFAIDVLTSAPLLIGWIDNELAATELLVTLAGLRLALTLAYLWHLLGPVKRWYDSEAPDDEVLLAADHAIQTLFRRMVVVQVLGWLVSLGVPLLLRLFDPSDALLPAEQVFAVSMMFVAMVFNPSIMFACFRQVCDAFTTDLGPQLIARRLTPKRARHSHARELVLLGMAIAFSTLTSAASSGFSVESKRTYERIEAQQREQLLRAGQELVFGVALGGIEQPGEPPPAPLELTRAELDTALVAQLEPATAPAGTLLSAIDANEQQVVAAYALGEGRWLQLATPIHGLMTPWLIGFLVNVVVLVGIVGLTMHWLSQALVGPLARLELASRRLAEHGELDSLARACPARDDEVGSLVENFNAVLDMLGELVHAARAISAGDLSVKVTHTGDLHDAFRMMTAQLREMVDRIRMTALEVTSASAEIHATMARQAELAELHNNELGNASQAIFGLAEAAGTIDSLSSRVLADAELNLGNIDNMVSKIAVLSGEARGVSELLDQIREVAERSDLLALNGSLEASRAGEAGRGFAIVAAEMRRLAERITGVVVDVRGRIEAIDETGGATVEVAEDGRKLATATAEVAREISRLSQAQSAGSQQASATATAMHELVHSVAAAMTQARSAADGLHARVSELEHLTHSFRLEPEPERGQAKA